MFDTSLQNKIEKLLKKTYPKSLKKKDIEIYLKIRKHKRRDLTHTLNQMVKSKSINRSGRFYSINSSSSEQSVIGRFDGRSLARDRSFAFVICEDEDYFVSSEDTKNAYDGDTVEIIIKYSSRGRKYAEVIKIIERKHKTVIGNLQYYGNKLLLIPDNSRLHTDFYVDEDNGAKEGDKVIISIKNWGSKHFYRLPTGGVTEILGKAGDPRVEVLSIIRYFDLPLEFPENVLQEANLLVEVSSQIDGDNRLNYKDLRTITVDPASAKDYDDAVSIESIENGYRLYIHIADVSHYVDKTSEVFKEALKRGNSYYFPKRVIPMLPEVLSNGACSLRPNEDKFTITVVADINNNGEITNQTYTKSIINSNARLVYEEVDDFFDGLPHSIPEDLIKDLEMMRKLSKILSKRREKAGYLRFNLPETQFVFDEDGNIEDLVRSKETESHKMIENFMLVANEIVATILSNQPTIYRIHEKPDVKKIEDLKEILKNYSIDFKLSSDLNSSLQEALSLLTSEKQHRVFDRMFLRSMKRAKYSTVNYGHFGLGMHNYTHFTSPIRRISDLIIHMQLTDLLNNRKKQSFSKDRLFQIAKQATERESIADESEKEVNIKNKINFMKQFIGEKMEGIITALSGNAIIVELDRYPVTGKILLALIEDDYYEFFDNYHRIAGRKKGKVYRLTDQVTVKIEKVEDDIYFQLVE